MADERQEERNQQSRSGSPSHSGPGGLHGSDRDATRQQNEQGRGNQQGQQTPKKDPQSSKRDEGAQKSGTR